MASIFFWEIVFSSLRSVPSMSETIVIPSNFIGDKSFPFGCPAKFAYRIIIHDFICKFKVFRKNHHNSPANVMIFIKFEKDLIINCCFLVDLQDFWYQNGAFFGLNPVDLCVTMKKSSSPLTEWEYPHIRFTGF